MSRTSYANRLKQKIAELEQEIKKLKEENNRLQNIIEATRGGMTSAQHGKTILK